MPTPPGGCRIPLAGSPAASAPRSSTNTAAEIRCCAAQVESILQASGDPGTKRDLVETIDPSTAAAAELRSRISASTRPSEPKQIGPYKLLEQIGEGGFGSVWVADQTAPVSAGSR